LIQVNFRLILLHLSSGIGTAPVAIGNRQSALQGENQAPNAFWSILPVVATFVSRGIEHAIGMCESRQTAAAQTVSWRQAEF
jgi:hypothetical protein